MTLLLLGNAEHAAPRTDALVEPTGEVCGGRLARPLVDVPPAAAVAQSLAPHVVPIERHLHAVTGAVAYGYGRYRTVVPIERHLPRGDGLEATGGSSACTCTHACT